MIWIWFSWKTIFSPEFKKKSRVGQQETDFFFWPHVKNMFESCTTTMYMGSSEGTLKTPQGMDVKLLIK